MLRRQPPTHAHRAAAVMQARRGGTPQVCGQGVWRVRALRATSAPYLHGRHAPPSTAPALLHPCCRSPLTTSPCRAGGAATRRPRPRPRARPRPAGRARAPRRPARPACLVRSCPRAAGAGPCQARSRSQSWSQRPCQTGGRGRCWGTRSSPPRAWTSSPGHARARARPLMRMVGRSARCSGQPSCPAAASARTQRGPGMLCCTQGTRCALRPSSPPPTTNRHPRRRLRALCRLRGPCGPPQARLALRRHRRALRCPARPRLAPRIAGCAAAAQRCAAPPHAHAPSAHGHARVGRVGHVHGAAHAGGVARHGAGVHRAEELQVRSAAWRMAHGARAGRWGRSCAARPAAPRPAGLQRRAALPLRGPPGTRPRTHCPPAHACRAVAWQPRSAPAPLAAATMWVQQLGALPSTQRIPQRWRSASPRTSLSACRQWARRC